MAWEEHIVRTGATVTRAALGELRTIGDVCRVIAEQSRKALA